jgi:catechol 2,3-dioxygenase-like lactoylglutathione lyase family enzyme
MEATISEPPFALGEVKQLDHFAIPAMDLERAEKFYSEVLGLRLIVKGDRVPGGMFLKIGRQHHLGLFMPLQTKATLPKRDTINSYPRVAFVLSPQEFDKTAAKVKNSCSVVANIQEKEVPHGEQGIGFIDSEGNIMEVFKGKDTNPIALAHVHFDTVALDDAVDFYTDVLNLDVIKKDRELAILAIPTGQAMVLHRVDELCQVTKTYYDERHFAFSVSNEDFHAIVEKLHRRGISEGDELGGGVNRKPEDLGTYFRDPTNGIYLQLLNRNSKIFSQKFGFVIDEG